MFRLLPFIHQHFNGVIWRLEIDAISDNIFVEVRNVEDKTVSFASVSLISGTVNFKDFTTPERWLTGIEAGYEGVLLLHHYQSANSPVHKGIVAVDGWSGATLWSNYTYAFDHLSVNGPVVFNIQVLPKKLYIIDIKTGTAIRAYDPTKDGVLVNHIKLPDIVPVSDLSNLPVEPYGNTLHYLPYNNFRIVSLHTFSGGRLKQFLHVLMDEELVFEDILNDDIQKIQPEAFLLNHNCLIYIKNKSELKVLNL